MSGFLKAATKIRLERIIGYTQLMLATLGIEIFEPRHITDTSFDAIERRTETAQNEVTAQPAPAVQPRSDFADVDPEEVFYMDDKYISTSARMRIEGNPLERESRFILLAGSELSPHIAYEPAGRLRQIYADSISNLKVTKDIVLKSPTQPAQIVAGASRNGWVYWKDSAGNTLHDRFRASEDL